VAEWGREPRRNSGGGSTCGRSAAQQLWQAAIVKVIRLALCNSRKRKVQGRCLCNCVVLQVSFAFYSVFAIHLSELKLVELAFNSLKKAPLETMQIHRRII
jgi:hypothetical protein